MNEKIVYNIKALMKIKGINQKELANRTKITECMISRYLKHQKKIPIDKLERIATALETTTAILVGYEEITYNKVYAELTYLTRFSGIKLTEKEKINLINAIIN